MKESKFNSKLTSNVILVSKSKIVMIFWWPRTLFSVVILFLVQLLMWHLSLISIYRNNWRYTFCKRMNCIHHKNPQCNFLLYKFGQERKTLWIIDFTSFTLPKGILMWTNMYERNITVILSACYLARELFQNKQ